MSAPTFEEKLKSLFEQSLIKHLSDGQWINPDYKNRVQIPGDFMRDVYSMIDTNAIKKRLAERINEELADRVVNHIAAELATDIKNILSVKERREEIRAIARTHIESLYAKKGEK